MARQVDRFSIFVIRESRVIRDWTFKGPKNYTMDVIGVIGVIMWFKKVRAFFLMLWLAWLTWLCDSEKNDNDGDDDDDSDDDDCDDDDGDDDHCDDDYDIRDDSWPPELFLAFSDSILFMI